MEEQIKTETTTTPTVEPTEQPVQEVTVKSEATETPTNTTNTESVETFKAEEYQLLQDRVKELETKLAEAKELKKTATTLQTSLNDLSNDVTKKDTIITEYETLINNVIDTKVNNVPEKFRTLIPSNLSLTDKLAWLENAENVGLFAVDKTQAPAVEIGKPMNVETPVVDVNKMSASELMKMAFNTVRR